MYWGQSRQERQRGWTNKISVPSIPGIDLNEAFALPRIMRKGLYINIDIWKKHKNFKCLQSGRRIAILLVYKFALHSKGWRAFYIFYDKFLVLFISILNLRSVLYKPFPKVLLLYKLWNKADGKDHMCILTISILILCMATHCTSPKPK